MTDTLLPNQSRDSYLEFMLRYEEADDRIAEAVAQRKDLRSIIKGAGFILKAFDRARRDSRKSGEVREEEERQYLRMMEWQGMAIGYQAEMPLSDSVTLSRVEGMGFKAGRTGASRESNPQSPNTPLAGVWDEGWARGNQSLADNAGPPSGERELPPGHYYAAGPAGIEAVELKAEAQRVADASAAKRRRGRPPKAAKAPTIVIHGRSAESAEQLDIEAAVETAVPQVGAKRRGRPPGAKNRPKEPTPNGADGETGFGDMPF